MKKLIAEHWGVSAVQVQHNSDPMSDTVSRMQAVAGIPETGVCDSATWEALLGAQGLQEAFQEAARLVSLAPRHTVDINR